MFKTRLVNCVLLEMGGGERKFLNTNNKNYHGKHYWTKGQTKGTTYNNYNKLHLSIKVKPVFHCMPCYSFKGFHMFVKVISVFLLP